MQSSLPRMLVCDLDGTLLVRGQPFADADLQMLRELGSQQVIRVIATGRALVTAQKVISPEFPIDYLIFSSGAGIMDWRTQTLLSAHSLSAQETRQAMDVFIEHELDFMIHAPIPHQHRFQFHRTGRANADFERRLARYAQEGQLIASLDQAFPASQLLAISPSSDPDEPFATVQQALTELSVIRATSPLDGQSMWIEVFAKQVSKSQGAAEVAKLHGIDRASTWAIGNDYNDWDLLQWAGTGAVVPDAPAAMRGEFATVRSVAEWLADKLIGDS